MPEPPSAGRQPDRNPEVAPSAPGPRPPGTRPGCRIDGHAAVTLITPCRARDQSPTGVLQASQYRAGNPARSVPGRAKARQEYRWGNTTMQHRAPCPDDPADLSTAWASKLQVTPALGASLSFPPLVRCLGQQRARRECSQGYACSALWLRTNCLIVAAIGQARGRAGSAAP